MEEVPVELKEVNIEEEEGEEVESPGTPPPTLSSTNSKEPLAPNRPKHYGTTGVNKWDLKFNDNLRRIDVILAFEDGAPALADPDADPDADAAEKEEERRMMRKSFLSALEKKGLELEVEEPEVNEAPKKEGGEGEEGGGRGEEGGEEEADKDPAAAVTFIKIHAPWNVLSQYAEKLHVQLPLQPRIANKYHEWVKTRKSFAHGIKGIFEFFSTPFRLNEQLLPSKVNQLMEVFSFDKKYLFDLSKPDTVFNPTQRSRIVNYILRRTEYVEAEKEDEDEEAGIKGKTAYGVAKLLDEGVFTDLYPLHDGELGKIQGNRTKRQVLRSYWASWKNIFKLQPLDYIRDYFGERIAFYFGWLEFYTLALIPAAIVGVFTFIYGMSHYENDIVSHEICHPAQNITLCPMCDKLCPYVDMSSSCNRAKASRVVDNGGTLFFAIFMSLWTTFFVELWKRQQAKLQFRWHQLSKRQREEMELRPEYVNKITKLKYTRPKKMKPSEKEFYYPFYLRRVPAFCLSFSFILFMIACSVAVVVGVIFYRIAIQAAIARYPEDDMGEYLRRFRGLIISATAATINLIFIFVLNFVYTKLAGKLTEMETFKTQADHDASLHGKIYALQFINFYTSIFYIAFLKGRLPDTPRSNKAFLGYKQEECDVGGCFIELTIQLVIIMVGKILLQGVVMEHFIPMLWKFVQGYIWKEKGPKPTDPSWKKDFFLQTVPSTGFAFAEYLELIIQFGFVTLFVASFPLAPLVALINNILETRVDAHKLLTSFRRPFAVPASDISIWLPILEFLSSLTVLVNALIIAFTTDIIPRAVYKYIDAGTGFGSSSRYPPTGNLTGYVMSTLSQFNVSDFRPHDRPDDQPPPDGICYYTDWRYGPDAGDEMKYFPTAYYWEIWGMRFVFVVAFQNAMIWAKNLFTRWISDTPNFIKSSLRHERRIIDGEVLKRAKMQGRLGGALLMHQ